MYFIQADVRGLLSVGAQQSIFPHMSDINKKMLITHFSADKKYSVINCQFAIHYFLADKISWSNFCQNINANLETNGYLLVTCFDGKILREKLLGKAKWVESYIDLKGQKKIFSEIQKYTMILTPTSLGWPSMFIII